MAHTYNTLDMVTPVAFAPRRQQAPEAVGTAKLSTASTALSVLGLFTASAAITVAVCVPPPALHKNAYFLSISCFFFAGVAGVMSAVCMATPPTSATATPQPHGGKSCTTYVLLAQLASVVGAAFSTKTALGMLGLAAASTAMNLQSVCQPPRDLDESDYYYHLAISGVFFADGVAGFMAAVRMAR